MAAASWAYFGREPDRLSDDQIALLIALPQSPEVRRPDLRPDSAKAARAKILDRLVELEVISARRAEDAKALDLPQTIISSLQMLKKANPKENEITQELVKALEMLGDWDQAEQVMLKLAQMNPEDPFLQQAYKDTAAKATIYRGNYDNKAGGQDAGGQS